MTLDCDIPFQIVVFFLVGGPVFFLYGLRKFNEKRHIENTPTSKVRSAAMGPVELNGMARMRKPLKSPLTNMECCWWQARVQELQSNGKQSHWKTILQTGSLDFFYLEDSTGKVLVNPIGADRYVLNQTFDLDAASRAQLGPVLQSWGINDMNWFGGNRRLRICHETLPDCAPLYVLGELVSLSGHLDDRQQRLVARLRLAKQNPELMKQADTNQDGTIETEEWDAFRLKQEEEFLKEEMSRKVQMPNQDNMLIQAPAQGLFIVSTQDEHSLLKRFVWLAPLGIVTGSSLIILGMAWGLQLHWNPLIIVGLLAIGFIFGFSAKRAIANLNLGGNRIWS